MKGGLTVAIIEKVSGDSGIDVLKVRVLAKASGSAVGYTISAGLNGYNAD
jgi:hypothetical protein